MKLPDYAAAPASVRFHCEIFQEHFEEAAFLYEQRTGLLAGGAVAWTVLDSFEQRLDAHIDALVVGGERAMAVCRAQASGDPGPLFAAVCVFCRQRRADFVAEALHELDPGEPVFVQAAADGLSFELPDDWAGFVERALRRETRLLPVLARVAGWRRLPVAEALQDALEGASAEGAEAAALALGLVADPASRPSLERCVLRPEPAVRGAALLSLLRIGARHALDPWFVTAQKEKWPRAALALGGDATVPRVFAQALRADHSAATECLLAIGQLGDPATIQWLYDGLRHPDLAVPAARALNRLTGADLYEELFKPEAVDEAELFDDELQAWRERGQPPLRSDGRPYGETVLEPSPRKDRWKAWLTDHAAGFADGTRYRRGLPCEPRVLLAELADERSGPVERASAAAELTIRYACPVPFDIAMPVAAQRWALQRIGVWVASEGKRFRPGGWYFAGQAQ